MGRGTPRSLAVVALVSTLLSSAAPALAYVDSGLDPREGVGADIVRTTREVWFRQDGRRAIAVRIRLSPEDQPLYFFRIRVLLDTRGDAAPDARMSLVAGDAASGARTPSCKVSAFGQTHEGELLGIGSRTGCRGLAAWVRPTKEVRWKIAGERYYGPAGVDLAPDAGWYGD